MNIDELIEALEDARRKYGGDLECWIEDSRENCIWQISNVSHLEAIESRGQRGPVIVLE